MRYQDAILVDRPTGLWMLNDAVGATVARGSAAAGNGTYVGSPTLRAKGPSGAIPHAAAFDGVDDHVVLPSLAWLQSAQLQSWEAWGNSGVDHTQSAGVRVLVGAMDATVQLLGFGGDMTGDLTNEVVTVSNDRGGAADRTGWTGGTILAGWHHHVFTYNGAQNGWRYFIDGHEWEGVIAGISKISNSGGALGLIGTGGVVFSLARVITFHHAWSGIAAAAVYSYALTPAQIARHYVAGRAGASTRDGHRLR